MRVFTDGACSNNGRPTAKAGYAVWFPEHPTLSTTARVPADQSQTNQRAELSAIHLAIVLLDDAGYHDQDIVIYTDSDYSINCLTKWMPGWVARGWKTSTGSGVLHRDLIEDASARLTKFKSHRFVHVRAHTGAEDDLSKNNDVVDRMARGTIEEGVATAPPPATDDLFPGCPLRLLGPPVSQTEVVSWVKSNLGTLDQDLVHKHMLKLFTELCKTRDVVLTKQTLQRVPMLRAERTSLQITTLSIEKVE